MNFCAYKSYPRGENEVTTVSIYAKFSSMKPLIETQWAERSSKSAWSLIDEFGHKTVLMVCGEPGAKRPQIVIVDGINATFMGVYDHDDPLLPNPTTDLNRLS